MLNSAQTKRVALPFSLFRKRPRNEGSNKAYYYSCPYTDTDGYPSEYTKHSSQTTP